MFQKYKPYIIGCAIPLAIGGLSSLLTMGNMDIYKELNQPALAPPAWLFPVMWTILYVLMGISSTRIYLEASAPTDVKRDALFTYGVQLVFNFFWSIIFFNRKQFLLSFLWIIALWWLISAMIKQFGKIDAIAAKLQIPYLVWVTFAGYLNFMIWILNR